MRFSWKSAGRVGVHGFSVNASEAEALAGVGLPPGEEKREFRESNASS
jgi:hypothetical protein